LAVATGGSHAPRGEGVQATTAAGNTAGRLRRHSPGKAQLPPVAQATEILRSPPRLVPAGGSHAPRGEGGGHHLGRQHRRAPAAPFARQSRSPTSRPGCRSHPATTEACSCWWEPRSAGRRGSGHHRAGNTVGRLRRHSPGKTDLPSVAQATEIIRSPPRLVPAGGSHAPRGEGVQATTAAGNTAGRLRRHSPGKTDLPPVAQATEIIRSPPRLVPAGGSHAPRGEGVQATTAAGNTAGRLRRHSPGKADLPPVAQATEIIRSPQRLVPAGGSHAPRGEGVQATTAAGNTAGRLRRHSPGKADLPSVAQATEIIRSPPRLVPAGGSHAMRGEGGGHHLGRQHRRAPAASFARQNRSPTSRPGHRDHPVATEACSCWWEPRSAGRRGSGHNGRR
jgi:hypothetical protein